jgi:hypothetical protein
VIIPSVTQVWMPRSAMARTALHTFSICPSVGDRHAAPRQNRVAPDSFAFRARVTISSASISLRGSMPFCHLTDCGQ